MIRALNEKGFTQQEIENMTLGYMLVISGVAICPEERTADGSIRLTPEEYQARFGKRL